MKVTMKYLLSVLLFLMAFTSNANANSQTTDLEINKVYENYGKQKGSTLVEMTEEMLEGYDFSFFKSITIYNNPEAANFTRECLKKDQQGAKKVKQVVANGVITSVYLQLPKNGKKSRLILFNETTSPERKMTLLYIESYKDSDEILKTILKKKQ